MYARVKFKGAADFDKLYIHLLLVDSTFNNTLSVTVQQTAHEAAMRIPLRGIVALTTPCWTPTPPGGA